MLHESYPWKCELEKLKLQLVRIASAPIRENAPVFEIEKPVLYSAIVVRRLIECWKVTDATRARKYQVRTYPVRPNRKGGLMQLTMKGDIDVEFDLSASQVGSMDAWDITSELLHSGFINWEINKRHRFIAIYLASKRHSSKRLIRLRLSVYLKLIDSIIADRVTEWSASVDQDGRLSVGNS